MLADDLFRLAHGDDGGPVLNPDVAALGLAAGLLGELVVTLDQFATLLGVGPASTLRWQLPAAYAVAAIGLAWALICKSARPQVWAAIGRGVHSVTTDERLPRSRIGR